MVVEFLLNVSYLMALALMWPWITLHTIRKRSFLLRWQQRWFGLVPRLDDRPTIWLHAVSVGEVNLLGPIVRELKLRFPNHQIAISSTTTTGLQLAETLFPKDTVVRFPLDFSWAIRQVFCRWNVVQVILCELELWPNLLRIASARNVPVAIVNGRLSDTSFKGYNRLRLLVSPMFLSLAYVAAQDSVYARNFTSLGVPPDRLEVTGNVKFDNCELDPFTQSSQNMRQLLGLKINPERKALTYRQIASQHERAVPVWVAGSTQEGEELIVLECFQRLRQTIPDLRLVLVPRHPERADSVIALIDSHNLNAVRLSKVRTGEQAIDNWSILLGDTIGDLKWLWSLADIAFVGGSFGDRGGQNMIEPAAFGASVAVGPNTRNFKEVVTILKTAECLTQLSAPSELYDWAISSLGDHQHRHHQADIARNLIAAQRGALLRTIDGIVARHESLRIEPTSTWAA